MKLTLQETLAIHLLEDIGSVTLRKLVQEFGDFRGIVNAGSPELAGLSWLPKKFRSGFERDRMLKAADEELAKAKKFGAQVITYFDERYPERLKTIDAAPIVLYVKGQIPTKTDQRYLSVVGSRAASRYGLKMARDIARGVAAQGVVIVSGLATGIDGAAHEGALEAGGITIGILGGGLNRMYPKEHRVLADRMADKGAVVSEFPMDMEAKAEFFPMRNRIISGLSEALLVVEAREKSGALITVGFALAQGRDVYAVPGNADSSKSLGTNRLIREGARMVTGPADVLEEMGIAAATEVKSEKQTTIELNESERRILSLLDEEECPMDDLIEKSQTPARLVIQTLSSLEFKGCVRQLPGKHFQKVVS